MAIILQIEKDKGTRDERSRLLSAEGHQVWEAERADAAIGLVASLEPQLVILGACHRDDQGPALCRTVKADPATTHILILHLSELDVDADSTSILPSDIDGYLIEPVRPFELLATVRSLVRLADCEHDHRRLKERHRQTERQFADVTEAAGCGLWDWEVQTGRLQWYGMHEQLAGMLPGGFGAKVEMFLDILHPEDRKRVWRRLQDLMARREAWFSEEYRFVHADGSVHWMLGTGRFVYDEEGAAVRMTGVVQDITERKKAEIKLILYRSIIESSTDAIAVIDRDGRYVEQNEAHRALLGFSDQDLLGQMPTLHTVGEPYERVMTALSTYGRFEGEIVSRRKDGTGVEIEMHAFPVMDDTAAPRYFVGIKRDITARKQAERALREGKAVLHEAVEIAELATYQWMPGSQAVTKNARLNAMFGLSSEAQFTYDLWRKSLHPDDRDDVLNRLATALDPAGDGIYAAEYRVIGIEDGIERWISAHGKIVFHEDRPITFVGTALDVTEQKRAETALRNSEERFRTLADNMAQLAWMADAREGLCWFNRRWLDYTGSTLEQMRTGGWESVVRSDYAECVLAGIHCAWESGEVWEDTFPIRSAEGAYRWFLSRAVPIRNPEGAIVRWFGTHTDVTELRQTEETLRRREEQLRIITDSVPSLISYVDREERYQFVNSGYEDLFGLPRHEIVGRSVEELLGPAYADVLPYVRRALTGETVRYESLLVYVGQPCWVMATYTPDIRADGTVAGFYVLVTDISERKQQEDELRRWKDELEVRVEERTAELIVSQDRLRTLASQLSLTEQRERRKLAGDLHDYLAQLLVVAHMKVAQAMRSLPLAEAEGTPLRDLDDILQQALSYTRTMIAELCPPGLHDAGLPAALRWLAERMQRHGLSVEVHSNCEQLPLPEDRAVFLLQSVRELLYNVLKHAGVDCATVSLHVGAKGDLSLAVEDRGRGLDSDALQRSVEPGHFGLLSVRERMDAMGGTLILENRPGGGMRVELGLPGVVSSAA